MLAVKFAGTLATIALTVSLTACASAPPRAPRSEFEDIPVPKGLTFQADRSKVYESPQVKAAWLVYRGRVEIESLAVAMRTTLEANGWRPISATATSPHGKTQIYEKGGTTLQVQLWEGLYYTYVEMATGRALSAAAGAPATPGATPR
jgi:hypothetical protein